MKTGKLLIILAFLFTATIANAQDKVSKKDIKQYDKAVDYFNDRKYTEADKLLLKLTDKYPWQSEIWELRAKNSYYEYLTLKDYNPLKGQFSVTVKGDGETSDSLTQALTNMLNNLDYGAIRKEGVVNICREATLKAADVIYACILLRSLTIDEPRDTAVGAEAKEQFDSAEEEFRRDNFKGAIKYYTKAIELEPTFYSAHLYLGDAYYNLKDYANAVKYFRKAIKLLPSGLEARKYIVDALYYMGSYDEGYAECKEAILVYPDISMFNKLNAFAEKKAKKFDKKWIPRGAFPNVMGKVRARPVFDKNWNAYADAQLKIEPFCDTTGVIVKSTSLTSSRYAEVYAWEELLKSTPSTMFTEARAMQAAGYLDCYVFLSLFHNDLYAQYKDFAFNNHDRMMAYLDMLSK